MKWRRDGREKSHNNTYREHAPCQSSDHRTAVERAPPPHTSIIKATAKVTAVVIESLCFNMNTIKDRP